MAGRVYDYSRLQGTASRLIRRFGLSAVLRRGLQQIPVSVAFGDYRSSQIDGAQIRTGDYIGYISGADLLEVLEGDRLFWEGAERTVHNIRRYKPGPTTVAFEVTIRGRAR